MCTKQLAITLDISNLELGGFSLLLAVIVNPLCQYKPPVPSHNVS